MKARTKDSPISNWRSGVMSAQKSSGIDTVRQLVSLAKENKYLRQELENSKNEISSIKILKAKYKDKYKKLKKEIELLKIRPENQIQVGRSRSGRIYRQRNIITESPELKPNRDPVPLSHSRYCKLAGSNNFTEDPYGMNSKQKSQMSKISIGIQSLINMLTALKTKSNQQFSQVCRNTEKLENIERLISDQIRQNKQILSKLNGQTGIKRQLASFEGKNQTHSAYTSQQDNFQHQEGPSANRPPEKDSQNYEQRQIKQKKALKLSQEKKRQSRSHKSMKEPKRLAISELRHNPEIKKDKESSEDDQSTKSKWQMLNQIGKRLKNWKFSYLDCDLTDRDQ